MAIPKTYMWAHPAFKKKLKQEALERDMSLLELTQYLSKNNNIECEKNEKKKKFTFSI
jgi:hypothetical protein